MIHLIWTQFISLRTLLFYVIAEFGSYANGFGEFCQLFSLIVAIKEPGGLFIEAEVHISSMQIIIFSNYFYTYP